ncbi:MAG: hypothetical protein JSV98_10465 [candidate division WOR-3 bacterium]|nr:MAG: hypothetical protein JSV98_10465 [candidate division WOR-3 bacterium]
MTLICILLSSFLQPIDSVILSRRFDRIEYDHNDLYAAPLIGKSIFRIRDDDSLRAFSFTNELNYQIRDFRVTPFAIYINRGTTLEKYYISAGIKEAVFTSDDIASFDLSRAQEIVLADRRRHEIIFLDFAYQTKFRIENISAEDLRWHEDLLYILTRSAIYIYDEYGNLIEKRPTPEICNRINFINGKMVVFAERSDYVYIAEEVWVKREFPYPILDLSESPKSLMILDENGTIIRFFDRNDF